MEKKASVNQVGETDATDGKSSSNTTFLEEVEKLRSRLLDLSARNPLLNYSYKKPCVQIVNEININSLFKCLYEDGREISFAYVPEPVPGSYADKRPDAKSYAASLGIATELKFSVDHIRSDRPKHLQTLFYPVDLERRLGKIASNARIAIEETGTNVLFLIFGFLEFFESDDSERSMLAPLLALPVSLARGKIDEETATYQYTVQHNGEDLVENQTLREKMRRDFTFSMPVFEDNDEPLTYFDRIEKLLQSRPRWGIRRHVTLGMLSFGKLAMWSDLDIKKNADLIENGLVQTIFTGGIGSKGSEFYAEDYRIDEQFGEMSLIYDADSSQHSAIIDVLEGKNLVINGPPGTGKSQTITNIIASALSQGKKVLFVSEKMAALEVVRHRLNKADLGHFCLELHSHKTQKKKLLEDVRNRIEKQFSSPSQFKSKMATLQRQRTELARHAEIMGSQVFNNLGFTVNEIFWAAERRRQELGNLSLKFDAVNFNDAFNWDHDAIADRITKLINLEELQDEIVQYDSNHPWWGFDPATLVPSDNEKIVGIVCEALTHASAAVTAASKAVALLELEAQPDALAVQEVQAKLDLVPIVPSKFDSSLLERMFDSKTDPDGLYSLNLLSDLVVGINKVNQRLKSAGKFLTGSKRLTSEELENLKAVISEQKLCRGLLAINIVESEEIVESLEKSLEILESLSNVVLDQFSSETNAAINIFAKAYESLESKGIESLTLRSVADRAARIFEIAKTIDGALIRLDSIAKRYHLEFNATPASVMSLVDPDSYFGGLKDKKIDEDTLSEARRLVKLSLLDKPFKELEELRAFFSGEAVLWSEALGRFKQIAQRFEIDFDSSEHSIQKVLSLTKVAAMAPIDLLDYRHTIYERANLVDLIEKINIACRTERDRRAYFSAFFYLDALPSIEKIKFAASVLRRKNNVFSWLDIDWRKARKLHADLCREERKLSGKQQAEELSDLAHWIEERENFLTDPMLKEFFGGLFCGFETNLEKIFRLNEWYLNSRKVLFEYPGLADLIDLTSVSATKLSELMAKEGAIHTDAENLRKSDKVVKELLIGQLDIDEFHKVLSGGWEERVAFLSELTKNLESILSFFSDRVPPQLSPKEALCLMEVKSEINTSFPDLKVLLNGERELRKAGAGEFGWLADMESSSCWYKVIQRIYAQASDVAEVISKGCAFAKESSSLAEVHAFVQTKLKFESVWSIAAIPPKRDLVNSWDGFIEASRDEVAATRKILDLLIPLAKNGASIQAVLAALDDEAKAHSILSCFSDSKIVQNVFGSAYEGAKTDLECLSTTHAWGKAICALKLPIGIRRCLLSKEAQGSLEIIKELYGEIDNGCRRAKEIIERLGFYGTFSWDDWQHQVRTIICRDFPSEIQSRLRSAVDSRECLLAWSKYTSLRRQAKQIGLLDFVVEVELKEIPISMLKTAFEYTVYQSIGRSIYKACPELSDFRGSSHERIRLSYQMLDAEIISLTGRELASRIAHHARVPIGQRGMRAGDFTEMELLHREINKQRNHIPIRKLIKNAGIALQELKPCFMMGPLSVAQYLESGALKFDLVVMDEASQMKPEEAIGAIARGSQLVVVGDPKQMPPTNFFDRMFESEEAEDPDEASIVSGMESILDICQQIFTPVRSLRWHYRSHHESLIAFSNHHFYKNLLIFPSPHANNPSLGVKYRYVEEGLYHNRTNLPEACRVVDAVLRHMIDYPDESLGVVTLNSSQCELIEELLDRKLKNFDEGSVFIDRWQSEGLPFFVKTLENVQGDERDVIFISATFGKAKDTGLIRQNFGPISRSDGWRRLNVLFTRSRRRIELFTSMESEDIIVDERTPLGTKTLRDYLDFAKRGVLVTTSENEREPDSDFEVSVANVIRGMGYEVKPQLGVAGFYIDLVVRNPDRPGEFLAAIECDGATYHSGFSVRDRDRIRQEILETLGWKGRIYRIWSTDWFYNPRREIDRLKAFLEKRRRLGKEKISA